MANKKLTPLEILYREFKNAKTDAARNEAWRRFEVKRGEMYPPRSDRKSAMLRDSAAVAAMFPEKVLGGENHRYYEPGRRIRMTVDETARRSPKVWVDPESGERYVRAFHYTQPENIENILKTGLVERLGPDAANYQNRPGVWTSFGEANPMGFDFVNRAYLGEKNYNMQPLEIRIPEEEWKSMVVDHTGKTGDDQVMVFRGSPAKPYGTTKVAGVNSTVVIPPEYVSRYEFPENYSSKHPIGGNTLYGWTPTKTQVRVNDEGFVKGLPDNIVNKAYDALGNNASYNDVAQWLTKNNQDELKNAIVNEKLFVIRDGDVLKGGLRGNSFRSPFNTIGMGLKKTRNNQENVRVLNLPYEAKKDWFLGTEFKTTYELADATEVQPSYSVGSVRKGYDGDAFPLGSEAPRTKKFLTDAVGDKASIKSFADPNAPRVFKAEDYVKNVENIGIKIPMGAREFYPVDYLKNSGVRIELGNPYNNNFARKSNKLNDLILDTKDPLVGASIKHKLGHVDDELYKNKYKERFDAADKADDVDAMDAVFEEFQKEKQSPEHVRKRIDYAFDYLKPNRIKDEERARKNARTKAFMSDEYNAKVRNDAEEMEREFWPAHSAADIEDMARAQNKNLLDEIAERNYKDELEKIMNTKRYEWRRQLENDSLNRVFGHELGRKIGKYRASRGKPVNPKQL